MKYKIMIADDDVDFVEVLRQRLEINRYGTVCAYEGVRAVEVAHREHPDLILLDWKMPDGKGSKVLEYLRAQDDTRKIPVIVITGADDSDLEAQAKRLGVEIVIRKPYDANDLLTKIKETLQWSKVDTAEVSDH